MEEAIVVVSVLLLVGGHKEDELEEGWIWFC